MGDDGRPVSLGHTASTADHAVRCAHCGASGRTICRSVDLASYLDVQRISGRRFVAAGQTVLANGGPASLVGTVLAGILKVTRSLPDGRERIVNLLYTGDFFGQPFFTQTDFAIEAATDVELCVADRVAYEGALARHPRLEHALLVATSKALEQAREHSFLLSSQTSLERVATYLLIVVERRDQMLRDMKLRSHKTIAALAISRADLASYLGTTYETISRHLHFLEDQGIIGIINSTHFEVIERERLQSLAGVSPEDLQFFLPSARGEPIEHARG